MKVIILAAGDNEDLKLPSCFNLTVGAITLLEYHTRILQLLGFNEKDIFIIKNQKDMDLNLKFTNFINIEKNNKKSFLSLKYFIDCCKDLEDLLIINGNSFFELKDLEKLINNPEKSKVLIEKRNSLYTKGIELVLENNNLIKVSDEIPKIIPWFSYYGAMFLTKINVLKIKNFDKAINKPYLNVIVNELGINLEKVDVNIQNSNTKTLELVGGSFAGLNKVSIVKKYANIEGNDKLIMEIEWLKNLPQDLKDKFPVVLDYQITPEESWFSMPFYEFENLRKKIISGKFSISQTSHFIEKILNYLFEKIYINNFSIASDDWVKKKHFDRFYTRLEKIKNIQPFNEILLNKYIIINGKKYLNLKHLIDFLREYQNKTNFFSPHNLIMIHGDLHFQNMLIDEENDDFILADPRGELNGSDIYYDFGKLWHSFNGLYDLIHTDISKALILSINQNESEFILQLGNDDLLATYKDIKSNIERLVLNYPVAKDINFDLKIKFAEIMHFSSLMWFHLKYDQKENRALCLYLQAIRLADDLLKELGVSYE